MIARARQVGWILMTLLATFVAGYAITLLIEPAFRPEFLRARLAHAPWLAWGHLGGGAIALITGALQMNQRLRRRSVAGHRFLGGVYLLAVLLAGLAGLILAFTATGGPVSSIGFGALAVLWLATTAIGFRHIHHGAIVTHGHWMVRSYALTLAAVSLRIYLPLALAVFRLPFDTAYPAIAWLCWVPNLLLAELWCRQRRTQQPAVATS